MALGVLSNKRDDFTVELVRQAFGRWRFGAVRGERAGVPRKPDPRAALEIASALGVPPAECAFVGDTGPNTGGMGSYSDSNHSLPFLSEADMRGAKEVNERTAKAIKDKTGEGYQGILYGGFMATRNGVRLIEYNARFGDPEAMNVLAILESDFVEICHLILSGNLRADAVQFSRQSTVCKYAVPEGYPDNPLKNQLIDVSEVAQKDALYYSAVDARPDGLYTTGSRSLAVVGLGAPIAEAEAVAEAEMRRVRGPLYHREDIGTIPLIKKRIEMMHTLRNHPL